MKNFERYWVAIVVIFMISFFFNPAIGCMIAGILTLSLGVFAMLILLKIQKTGIKCVGKILSYETGNRGYKTPIIEFKTVEGETVTKKPYIYASTDLSKIRTYEKLINTEVFVLYDPNNPKKFILFGEQSFNYIIFSILILAGLFLIFLSIYNFL